MVAGQAGHLAGHGPAGALERVHADHAGQQRGPHDATLPGDRTLVQRGQHAEGAVHAGEQVGDRDAHLGRLRGAGDRHQAALALGDLVVARPLRLRPVVPEAGDRQHDQPGVELAKPLDGEPEPVQDPTRKFSISTSARSISRVRTTLSASDLRSRTRDSLLRLAERKYVDSRSSASPMNGGPHPRVSSPVATRS